MKSSWDMRDKHPIFETACNICGSTGFTIEDDAALLDVLGGMKDEAEAFTPPCPDCGLTRLRVRIWRYPKKQFSIEIVGVN